MPSAWNQHGLPSNPRRVENTILHAALCHGTLKKTIIYRFTQNLSTPKESTEADVDDAGGSLAVLVLEIAETHDKLTHLGVTVASHLERDGRETVAPLQQRLCQVVGMRCITFCLSALFSRGVGRNSNNVPYTQNQRFDPNNNSNSFVEERVSSSTDVCGIRPL